jgi:nuclear cap-binding protein subunit 1
VNVNEIITGIQTYVDSVPATKRLVQPLVRLHSDSENESTYNADEVRILTSWNTSASTVLKFMISLTRFCNLTLQLLDCALAALSSLSTSSPPFAETSGTFLQPYLSLPGFNAAAFDLPAVLVPPEVIELDGMTTEEGEDAPVKKEEWPDYYVRLFDNEVGYSLCSSVISSELVYAIYLSTISPPFKHEVNDLFCLGYAGSNDSCRLCYSC